MLEEKWGTCKEETKFVPTSTSHAPLKRAKER